MLFSFFIVCAVALGLSTVLLVAVGRHIHHDSLLGGLLAAVVYFIAGWIAAQVWSLPAGPVEAAGSFAWRWA